MEVLRFSSEIRYMDTMLSELKSLRDLSQERYRRKLLGGHLQVPSTPNPSPPGDQPRIPTWDEKRNKSKIFRFRAPALTWGPPAMDSRSEIRSRKRRKLFDKLRAIDEMKAQLCVDRHSRRLIKPSPSFFPSRDAAETMANLNEIENIRSVFASLPKSMQRVLNGRRSEKIREYLNMTTEFLHKPYMSLPTRQALEKRSSEGLPLLGTLRMSSHLQEGDIIHIPFSPSERRKFHKYVSVNVDPLLNLELICKQLPGRTVRDCRRYFLDEYKIIGKGVIKRDISKDVYIFRIRSQLSRQDWRIGYERVLAANPKASHRPPLAPSCENRVVSYKNVNLNWLKTDSISDLILSRESGRGYKSLISRKHASSRRPTVQNSEKAHLKASRHKITRILFGRLRREALYEENTGGSITDVKFGCHSHTKDKIIYGVTDSDSIQCAVYDTRTKKGRLLLGHTDAVEEVHITPWSYITGSHDTNINIYSLDGDMQWQFKDHKEKILSISMHIAKPLFASAAYQLSDMWLCNYKNKGKLSLTLPVEKPTVPAGAMSFGNQSLAETLAIGAQDVYNMGSLSICRVNVSRINVMDTFSTSKPVQCVARPPVCSPLARKFLFSCSEEKLYIYDTTSMGKRVESISVSSKNMIRHASKGGVGHNIHDCSFSPSGLLVQTCGEDNTVVVHDIRKFSKPIFVLEHDYMGGSHGVACQWSADSRFLVSGADDCTVRLWDVSHGNSQCSFPLTNAEEGEGLGSATSEVGLIKHNQSGAICALSLSVGSDMVVAGSTSGRIVIHTMKSFDI